MPPNDQDRPRPATLAVIGAGYVGLATAAGLLHLGHAVRVADIDAARIAALVEGRLPIAEPGVGDLIADAVGNGHITFHNRNAKAAIGADAVFVAVPTPEGADGSVDLSAVEAALTSIAGGEAPIVIKSSVPPGSARQLERLLGDAGSTAPLVINPEFLQEGRALDGVLHPTRVVVGGSDPVAVGMVAALHRPLGAPIVETDAVSAELAKYAANAYLATRLTFVNSIAHLAEAVGADVDDVLASLAHDPRIGAHYLRPGPGYGGSCFPKDVRALVAAAAAHGHDLDLLRSVVDTNDAQLDRVVAKVAESVGGLDDAVVAMWGDRFQGRDRRCPRFACRCHGRTHACCRSQGAGVRPCSHRDAARSRAGIVGIGRRRSSRCAACGDRVGRVRGGRSNRTGGGDARQGRDRRSQPAGS